MWLLINLGLNEFSQEAFPGKTKKFDFCLLNTN